MKISIVIFIVLDDEHKSQIISNIHQVKERGATTIILTNVADIGSLIDLDKLDYVVNLPTSKNDILAALQAIIPL
jgi:glucosamine 6-phosphate synthetase-like amidotransferase/phosphosugar isomerase protein